MPRPSPPLKHADPVHRPKLLVFGSRGMEDYNFVKKKLDRITFNLVDPIVVHGASPGGGVDWLADRWAQYNWFMVMRNPPDKRRYGSPACFHVRNKEMVEYVAGARPGLRYAVAFWDGDSPGTASMLKLVKKAKIPLRVVRC